MPELLYDTDAQPGELVSHSNGLQVGGAAHFRKAEQTHVAAQPRGGARPRPLWVTDRPAVASATPGAAWRPQVRAPDAPGGDPAADEPLVAPERQVPARASRHVPLQNQVAQLPELGGEPATATEDL
eukprot:3293554-Pyramimonas_sp.AAC.1